MTKPPMGGFSFLVVVLVLVVQSVLTRRKEIAPRLRNFEQDKDLVIVNKTVKTWPAWRKLSEWFTAAGLFPEKEGVGADPSGISFAEAPGGTVLARA